MRLGILLILLQSMLLCAEGRAEAAAVQLDSVESQIGIFVSDGDAAEPDESDPQAIAGERYRLHTFAVSARETFPLYPPISIARVAPTIRGPPPGQ